MRRAPALCVTLLAAVAGAHEPGERDEAVPALTAPVLVERADAVYPEAARRAGIGGTVGLEITVDADGSVSDVKVARAAGFGLDEAAVAAARRFKFRPATDHGKPVASTVLFDQSFVVRAHLSAETDATPAPTETPVVLVEPPPGKAPPKYGSTVTGRGPTSAASATTIRNQDFDLRPKTSPNDILRVVPGLLAVQHQGGGKADQLFLRGFDADHGTDVGIFVDGIPVNLPSHAHGQGYADLHWIIPEAFARIDVVKGPYDARWGDFSTAGAVNLVTAKDFPESFVQATLGGFPTLGSAGKLAATERLVALASPHFDGWAEKLHPWIALDVAHDDGPFVNPEDLRRYNLMAKLSYDVSPSTTAGAFFSAYASDWIGSGQIPQRLVNAGQLDNFGALDPSEGGLSERQMFSVFLRHRDPESEYDVTAYVVRYRMQLWNDFTFFLENPTWGSEIEQDDARTYGGVRGTYHFHRSLRGIDLRTTLGVEARLDDIHVDRWDAESCAVDGIPAAQCPGGDFRKRLGRRVDDPSDPLAFSGANDDIVQSNVAGFVEEDAVFARWLRVIGALRFDYFDWSVSDLSETLMPGAQATSGVAQRALVSPKATVVLTPIRDVLDVYLNYGTGFHTNMAQVALLDGQTRIVNGAQVTLHATPRFYGGELGARLHLGRFDVASALWTSWLDNETVFDADTASWAPAAATFRLGVDGEARARITDWLFADLDVAWARATAQPDVGNGGAVALAPQLYGTGGVTAKHPSGWRARLGFRFLGPRPAFAEASPEYQYFTAKTLTNGQPNPDYNPDAVTAQGWFVVDAYVAYRWRFLEASAVVQNLLDTTWREAQFGNRSCTWAEAHDPSNPSYNGSGNQLSDGSYVNRCGVSWGAQRSGVVDVHYTPGVPFDLQLNLRAYF